MSFGVLCMWVLFTPIVCLSKEFCGVVQVDKLQVEMSGTKKRCEFFRIHRRWIAAALS